MLLMTIATLLLLLIVVGAAFSAYFLFTSHKSLQNSGDHLALNAAQQLNINDYAGRINNMIGHSRELVYTSREMYSKVENNKNFSGLEPLAAQVLNQSRSGATLVAQERDRLVKSTIAQLRQMVNNRSEHGLYLINLAADNRRVDSLSLGYMDKVQSNVEPSKGVTELFEYDLSKHFLQQGKDFDLYRANVNLQLPEPDGDLKFELSSLPAPVENTTAPMRLTLGDNFKKTFELRTHGQDTIGACKLMPSAVQASLTMHVQESIGKLESDTVSTNTACTNGASLEP